jgi:hypothetical protein
MSRIIFGTKFVTSSFPGVFTAVKVLKRKIDITHLRWLLCLLNAPKNSNDVLFYFLRSK